MKTNPLASRLILTVTGGALMTFASVQGAIININIQTNGAGSDTSVATPLDGTPAGATVAPLSYAGNRWNDVITGVPAGGPFLDSEGTGTSVSLSFTNSSAATFNWGDDATTVPMLQNYFTIHNGFGSGAPGASTLNFTGLGDSTVWNVYVISQGDASGQGGDFTIGGNTKTSLGDTPGADSFAEGSNYVLFANVVADGSGNLDITMDSIGGGNGFGALNGIQLESVPEPSVALLGGLGLLGLVRRRR